jgi:quinol monooxygenase YgiN
MKSTVNARRRLVGDGAAMVLLLLVSSCSHAARENTTTPLGASPNRGSYERSDEMVVRISEIDLEPDYLEPYLAILKVEAEASLRLEPGVISIFPMSRKDAPTAIRIVEIYASRQAYELHLKTPHFQTYKIKTLKMIKSLRLVDMEAIDAEAMTRIFRKM